MEAETRFSRGETIHDLFGWCVRKWPSSTAVVHADRRMSYEALDALSDTYAAELEARGVGPGCFVPVLMHRSPEFVAVLLAVLKRGAAYAAFDRRWPRERVSTLIELLSAPLLVTSSPGPWPVAAWTPPSADEVAADPRRPSPVTVGADAPCTVFFTSGSSGTPKGVVSPHSGTVRLFDDPGFLALGPGAVMPQINAVPWDGFTMDCWSVLTSGGTCVLVDEPVLMPRTLRALVREERVSIVFMTTALFNMLVDTDPECFTGIGQVTLGGEKMSPHHCRRFLRANPGIELYNLYGPVECTMFCTVRRVREADCDDPAGVPLGRLAAHSTAFIMDGDRLCGPGEVGEIGLGGAGLAVGYLGDPELTARRFVQLEVEGRSVRVYRTGDLGHRSGDGTLYFDGRADRQVKVRGHRIELGDLEQNALADTRITGCVAVPVTREDGTVDGVALCYLADPQYPVTEEEVRSRLAERMPGHLMPRWIRRLERFPLLSNGKTDTAALATMPDLTTLTSTKADGSAPTGTAAVIAEAIRDVFGIAAGSPDAVLLDLAGSSLDVARLCVALETALHTPVPVSQVFRSRTVGDLAAWLDSVAGRQAEVGPTGRQVPLTPMQRVFVLARGTRTACCPIGWWYDGTPDPEILRAALTDVHYRHQTLHARYVNGDEPYAVVPDRPGPPEFHHLPEAADDQAALTVLSRALAEPLSIEEGRVWRSALVRSAATGRALFGFTVHHIAFDGWSEPVLAGDISLAYEARRSGGEPAFAEPVASLAGIATEYRRHLDLVDLDVQRGFWPEQLRDLPELKLPDRRDGEFPLSGPTVRRSFRLSEAEVRPWDEYARTLGMTRFTCLLAAYASVLRDVSGQDDIGVVVPVAMRGNRLIDRAVTCRMNYLCLRMRDSGDDLLTATRRTVDDAMAAQDLPYIELLMLLAIRGAGLRLDRLPVFQYQDDPLAAVELDGVRVLGRADVDEPYLPAEVEVRLEVVPEADGGLTVTVAVRTDALPATFADVLGGAYLDVIRRSPDRSTVHSVRPSR